MATDAEYELIRKAMERAGMIDASIEKDEEGRYAYAMSPAGDLSVYEDDGEWAYRIDGGEEQDDAPTLDKMLDKIAALMDTPRKALEVMVAAMQVIWDRNLADSLPRDVALQMAKAMERGKLLMEQDDAN